MMFNRIICSVILVCTVLSVGASCFAASLTPAPISPGEVINNNEIAIDDGSLQSTENDSRAACLPGQIESPCIDSQETLPPSDTDNLIALWNAFDLPNKK